MPNVCLSHLLVSLLVLMLTLFVVPLVVVLFVLIGTFGNKVLGATTIVACSLFLVWELSLHNFIPILL
jgi:hypothetical protein